FTIWQFGTIAMIVMFTIFIIDLYYGTFRSILIFSEISLIITSSLIIFSIIMVMINETGNKSIGSLDNATGMALVFELSSFFKQNPLNNFNIWFCQFSAEEIGTMGSRFFVDAHKDMLIKDNVYQINFDMVSCKEHSNEVEYVKSYGVFPKKESDPRIMSILEGYEKEEDFKIKGHILLSGAHTDSVPFHQLDIKAIDFTTPIAAKYSHSIMDTPDKVDIDVISDTFIIVKNLMKKLDEK
ncbi:MAG: M28 family peptidase, partial [Candidatus Lokiarchaeota archaeon]